MIDGSPPPILPKELVLLRTRGDASSSANKTHCKVRQGYENVKATKPKENRSMSNKPPTHKAGKASSNLSWQQQLLNSTSSSSLSHQNNNHDRAHRKRGGSADRRRPSNNPSRGYQGGKNSGYNRSRKTPPRRSPTVRESGGGNNSLDFGQLSVAQIKKRLPDALKTRNYKLAGLLLRNAPGKPMLTISSGDPLNFSMLDILRKLFGAGQTTHVADFIF